MNILQNDVDEIVTWLSSIGGTPEGGTTRLLYTKEWLDAQNQLKKRMDGIGLTTYFDKVGNLFGALKGSKYPEEIIMSGSHVDTVVNGGKLDGQLGIVAAILAVNYLKQNYGQPLRTIEIVSMAEEEGSRFPFTFFGSKNIFNLVDNANVVDIADSKGVKFTEAMKSCGFEFNDGSKRDDIKAFIELHIEQGGVLEAEKKSIGVVTSIVGQRRYTVKLIGLANHAGTTPMGYRKDAVYGFSCICVEAVEKAKKAGDPLVLTFGRVDPKPNVVNVVPGVVEFSIDCRHTDAKALIEFTTELENDMRRIAKEKGLEIDINLWMDEKPIPMDDSLVSMIEKVCEQASLSYRVMHSGAGHDSQIFAPFVPTAMIFVPSVAGISHNPKEFTHLNDLVEGVKTLTHILYELSYK